MLILTLLTVALIIAGEIVALLTPVIVFAATELVKKFADKIAGWMIISLIVPLLSIATTLLTDLLLQSDINFWLQVGLGLLAVFVNELLKQFNIKK